MKHWEMFQQLNSNADSRMGWSTAFFALIISSLIAIGFGVDNSYVWYIVGPIMVFPIISILLLIISMNPHPKHKKSEKQFSPKEFYKSIEAQIAYEESQSFENLTNFVGANSALCINSEFDPDAAIDGMYKLIDKKTKLLNIAYYITFPFLYPIIRQR